MIEGLRHERVLPRLGRGVKDEVNQFSVSFVPHYAIRIWGKAVVREYHSLNFLKQCFKNMLYNTTSDLPEPDLLKMLVEDLAGNIPIIADLLGSYGHPMADPCIQYYSNPDQFPLYQYTSFQREFVIGSQCHIAKINSYREPGIRGFGYYNQLRTDCVLTDVTLQRVKYRQVAYRTPELTYGRQRQTDHYSFVASNWRVP